MKKALLTVVLAVSAATLLAAPVSLDEARRVAETFWLHNLPKGCERASADVRLVENTGFDRFYIFDIDQGKGFVIVSADDCAYPVLGYSVGHPAGEMGDNVRTRNPVKQWPRCSPPRGIRALITTVCVLPIPLRDALPSPWPR